MVGQNKKKGLFVIKVWLNEDQITSMTKEAEKLNFRRVGLPIKTQKPHGFADEWVANTDGISRYLKFCHTYFKKHEAERLERIAEVLKKEQEVAQEKKKLLMGD
jgi:hypothetical protein